MSADHRQAELAVFATQLHLKHVVGSSDVVSWDVRLPDPDGDPRQVDVLVERKDGTISTIEVQDRSRPLDKGSLGGLIDKANEVGAEQLTVVSNGISPQALRRIQRGENLNALVIRDRTGGDAIEEVHVVLEGQHGPITAYPDTRSVTIDDAPTNEPQMHVTFGGASSDQVELSIAIVEPVDGSWLSMMVARLRDDQRAIAGSTTEVRLRRANGRSTSHSLEHLESGPLR